MRNAVLQLNARAWGIAFGLLAGLGLFGATLFLTLKGGENVGQHLQLLGIFFPGYRVTIGGAFIGLIYGFVLGYAGRIAAFSLQSRIPAIDGWAPFARQGNLLTYGPVIEDVYRRLATYVDRIGRGARPAELPVELPAKVELVINLKTARTLGVTIPESLLQRADELIR